MKCEIRAIKHKSSIEIACDGFRAFGNTFSAWRISEDEFKILVQLLNRVLCSSFLKTRLMRVDIQSSSILKRSEPNTWRIMCEQTRYWLYEREMALILEEARRFNKAEERK